MVRLSEDWVLCITPSLLQSSDGFNILVHSIRNDQVIIANASTIAKYYGILFR